MKPYSPKPYSARFRHTLGLKPFWGRGLTVRSPLPCVFHPHPPLRCCSLSYMGCLCRQGPVLPFLSFLILRARNSRTTLAFCLFQGFCRFERDRESLIVSTACLGKNTTSSRDLKTHPKSYQKNTAFTRTFSKSSRELFPAFL